MGSTNSSNEDESWMSLTSSESSSSSSSEGEQEVYEEPTATVGKNEDIAVDSITDLKVLFDASALKMLPSLMKDDVPLNILQQHQSRLLSWLNDLNPASCESVTLEMFCDFLASRGVSREDSISAFNRFDLEGNGKADVDDIIAGVKHIYEERDDGELHYSYWALQSCSFLPGFVDVFSRTDPSSKHAAKILNFLLRNRAPSTTFSLPLLSAFDETVRLRGTISQQIFTNLEKSLKESEKYNILTSSGDSTDIREVGKPYTSMQVSSNCGDINRLVDNDNGTYWQSNGSARSHWIRINMKKNVVVKQLMIYVFTNDQSYMPKEVVISVGKSNSLREIKEIRVPVHINGPVLLLENMKAYYPIIQIGIRRCHSDGCDTRIHQVKVVGLRVCKEYEMTIADASIRWFVQLITSTALQQSQSLPFLRDLVINQTKEAFKFIPPMSLCQGSSHRPKFLTDPVLEEIKSFLEQVTRSEESVLSDGSLLCKLMYGLACCNLSIIISVISVLLGDPEKTIDPGHLIMSMNNTRKKYWSKGAKLLSLVYLDCDGGEAASDSTSHIHPREILSYEANSVSCVPDSYQTKAGRTKLTMILDAQEMVQVTKLIVRSERGNYGAQCGLIFLLPYEALIASKSKNTEEKESAATPVKRAVIGQDDMKYLYKRFEKYDSWTGTEYEQFKAKGEKSSDGLIAYFSLPEDWDETEVLTNEEMSGRIIIVKFLRPRSDTCDKIGVVGLNVFGYSKSSEIISEIGYDIGSEKVSNVVFCKFILSFLLAVLKSVEKKGGQSLSYTLPPVDFTGLTVAQISQLFNEAQRSGDTSVTRKVLHLLHCIFLCWTPSDVDNKEMAVLFETFSSIINSPQEFDVSIVAISRIVIVDGAKAFFPNDQTRKEQLIKMLRDIERADRLPSTSLVFESLCQFFSHGEPSALLNLPKPSECMKNSKLVEDLDESCIQLMETIASVMLSKAKISMRNQSKASSASLSSTGVTSGVTYPVLLKLLSCLQTGFLSWTSSMQKSEDEQIRKKSSAILLSYIKSLTRLYDSFTKSLMEEGMSPIQLGLYDGDEFVYMALHEVVVFLQQYTEECNSSQHRMDIVTSLWPLAENFSKLSLQMPDHFHSLDSSHWTTVQTGQNFVLKTWVEESSHNYADGLHLTKVFNCAGAKQFIVEFDSRCATERKYDYLEFTNSAGISTRYDCRVGTETWPSRVEFKGSKLQFSFHSDQSNNEWGYKFTVTAKGVPESPINPLFDLHLSLALLLGSICGQTMAVQPIVKKTTKETLEEDNEAVMLRSSLWRTLFRAGYQIGSSKLERSLSGRFTQGLHEEVIGLLIELLNDTTTEPVKSFVDFLRSKCRHYKNMGSSDIQEAVLYVFAALVWHTSDLRESLNDYIRNGFSATHLSDGISQAYNLAEQLRAPLINLRQKAMAKGDSSDFTLAKEIKEKADLLLKFAPLAKSQRAAKSRHSKIRKLGLNKSTTSDLLKRVENSIPDKYGQFYMVLEFILEPSWNCQMVEKAIRERTKSAKSLILAYQFASKYLKPSDDIDLARIDGVVFLRALLNSQKQFLSHYADAVDGCGLELESKLRQQFYSLVRLLVSAVDCIPSTKSPNKNVHAAHCSVQACLLHLLDTDWRDNDLSFLKEINLPKLLFESSKNHVAVRDRTVIPTDDAKEMEAYNTDQGFLKSCQNSFTAWYNTKSGTENKTIQMFIARHCDRLDVEIQCDGCKQAMPGRRYRCLDCFDMDLCVACFTGGVNPGRDHKDDHSFVYFMYKCDICQAFISGERVHCKICDDFDLCYGCYKTRKCQDTHEVSHEVERFPQVVLKASCETNLLSSYIHQHAWLLFAQHTLFTAGAVFEQTTQCKSSDTDSHEYTETASHLLSQCLALVTESLHKVSTVNAKGSAIEYKEEAFVQHSQERIMGLLGAIITLDENTDADLDVMLTTVDFLQFIFYIASGNGGYEPTVQHLALGLLAQLMQKTTITPEVTDDAITRTLKTPPIEYDTDREPGVFTIDFLLQAAAVCLDKPQGVDWSYSLIRLLQQLLQTPHWSAILKKFIVGTINQSKQKGSLKLVLCLFIITGFPQLKAPGVIVKYPDYGNDERKAVILKHFPDKIQSMLIDTNTRKRRMVKDEQIECDVAHVNTYDEPMIELITQLLVENFNKLLKGAVYDTETHWILSLCLKAFVQFLPNLLPYQNLDVIRCLVNLSGMGTRISKHWLITDLEIASLMLYIKLESNPSKVRSPVKHCSPPPRAASAHQLGDIDDEYKSNLLKLLDIPGLPKDTLQNIYDNHRTNPGNFLHALHLLLADESPEKAKKSRSEGSNTDKGADSGMDYGILPAVLPPFNDISVDKLEACYEDGENDLEKAKSSNSSNQKAKDKRRAKSAELLKSELNKLQKQKTFSGLHLNKVNLALAVLHARQALVTILGNWPIEGPRISAQLLNCEEANIALVLDVLNRDDDLKRFEKVVAKVMSCCREDCLQSVADAAAYFMEDRKLDSLVRESPQDRSKRVKGKATIEQASFLVIKFDECCKLNGENQLQLSTTVDMDSHLIKLAGARERWRDVELPGNTVYFRYSPTGADPGRWKFTVTAGRCGSFFTGYVILNHILSTTHYCQVLDSSLLWKRLVVVACKQVGPQRLKVINLLLYLLYSYQRLGQTEGSNLKLDLTYLSPLWKLYKKLSEDHGPEKTAAVVRALTELFLVAEDVAMQWGESGRFAACMLEPGALEYSITAGLERVLAVTAAISKHTDFPITER